MSDEPLGTTVASNKQLLERLQANARAGKQLTFAALQHEVNAWARRNFPKALPHHPFIGIVEEVGELAHAHLKKEQGIRDGVAKYVTAAPDAVGDIIIYLADYCAQNGLNLQRCVEDTWARVQQRDWQKDPVAGGREEFIETTGTEPGKGGAAGEQLDLFATDPGK